MKMLIITLLLLVTSAAGQTRVQPKTIQKQEFKWFNPSDGAYWGGALLDVGSSVSQRELNPLFRNQSGQFSTGKNVAFKAGLWGVFKFLESRYREPGQRRQIAWVKIGAGIAFGVVAAHNFSLRRR